MTPRLRGAGRPWWQGRRPAVLLAAALLTLWCGAVLGRHLPALLAAAAALIGAAWLIRRRRSTALALLLAAGTAVLPLTATLLVMTTASAADVAALLTGAAAAAPAPTLAAHTTPGRHRLVDAFLGSVILLTATAAAATASPWAPVAGPPLLAAGVVAGCAVAALGPRRRAAAAGHPVPGTSGWVDLGRRRLPGGERVDRVLVGPGNVIAAVTGGGAADAVRTAGQFAAATGVPPSRIQPVLLTETRPGIRRRAITTAGAAAAVVVTDPDSLSAVCVAAPRHRFTRGRRLLRAVAALPEE